MSREVIESEIKGSEAAIQAHETGAEIHKIVVKAFKKELEKLPKEKKKPNHLAG